MRRSQLFTPTGKADEREMLSRSLELSLRGGFVRQTGSGLYSYTPTGVRVLYNISSLVRKEMNNINAQEVLLPSLQPAELWKESGRWEVYKGSIFTIQDSQNKKYCLAPTCEEAMVDLVRGNVRSYKNLPLTLYQFSQKYRDEKVRQGLFRTKEFLMKDAYSFHFSEDDLDKTYQKMRQAYTNIFEELELDFFLSSAETGEMGGKRSEELIALTDVGTDKFVVCSQKECHFGSPIDSGIKECSICGRDLQLKTGIELAHLFKLGDRYSKQMDLTFADRDGSIRYMEMGCYGIGISRLIPTIIEQNNDEKGIIWPENVAPFKEVIIPTSQKKSNLARLSNQLYYELNEKRLDPLLDDRDVSAGTKFAESDLMGIPRKIIIGPKSLAKGKIEVEHRRGGKDFLEIENFVAEYIKKYYLGHTTA